ncbi:sodium/myo-inositol cotransporter 2-like isoform X1 [Scyliorhinus canicula]|uniref:sodium/myo-inositol cotransporter 2-like isoform X1 n=1 Tax=Scyliorhinus canicula TaxID=7830 RepID=UPI0018F5C07B|nr:sodium/myo-inositol cotransporter 2-like isoform X1 [Scyliorhinus canicula]
MKTITENPSFRADKMPASTLEPAECVITHKRLNVADIIVMVLYLITVLFVGFWSMYKRKRSTVSGYFLAGRKIPWWPIGASLFASNVGSGHFIGLAGSGASSGIAVSVYEWSGMYALIILGWLFLPIYIAAGVTTMPEYLLRRFGGQRIHFLIALLSLFAYIFTKISVDIYAGGIFINLALRWDLYLSVIGLLIITAVYTIGGGLAAVIYTDALQTLIILAGAMILMVFAFIRVDGYSGLKKKYFMTIPTVHIPNSTCGFPREDAFHIFQDPINSDYPWPGVIFGITVLSTWYWCTDQVIVQRTLSSKSILHAKGGIIFAAYLKILPIFIIVFPGMISRVLFTNLVACAEPATCRRVCGNPLGCTDIAYPLLVMELLPGGLRGLMMSVMIAALMSSLTSIFNSASTLFTMDIWHHIRPHCSEWELMVVGRLFVLVLVIVSILWLPLVQMSQGGQLFIYIQSITSYLTPPIAVVFITGCFWTRTNEKGAFWGLVIGICIGIIRMILDMVFNPPPCGQPDERPTVVSKVHFLYFALILSFITLIVVVIISLLTHPPPLQQISRLTWYTRHDKPPEIHTANDLVESDRTLDSYNIEDSETTIQGEKTMKSRTMSILMWICGLDTTRANMPYESTDERYITSLYEEPVRRYIVNANLIICLTVIIFLYCYFA